MALQHAPAAALGVALAACGGAPPAAPPPPVTAAPVAAAPAPAPSAAAPAPPGAAAGRAPAAAAAPDRRTDEHSYAEPTRVRVRALALDLTADFAARQLAGTATLDLTWLAPRPELVLDTRDLAIERVEALGPAGTWRDAPFTLGPPDPILGRALTIAAPGAPPSVRITYRTSPAASGLQWLPPALTTDGRHPMLFTQSQAIHARSWVPLQDTPGVRFPYRARVRTPPGVLALMSAANDPAAVRDGDHSFEMAQPIPSYLLALAIGDFQLRAISARVGVWAEPSMVARAAAELADTERMVTAVEGLYGPYRWGRYDLLILPPSFPYGGMENPRLSFITPTVITGDRSLIGLIAHELAHSWAGNLVTAATWKDIWLNEGITTYVENRVIEALFGREAAEIAAVLEQRALREGLRDQPAGLQRLRLPALTGLSPDAAGTVAYGKGQWLLLTLERRFGRAPFDAFLRRWFARHAFQSVTTDDFVAALRGELMAAQPGALSEAELAEWLDGDGVPASAVPARSARLARIDELRAAWLASAAPLTAATTAGWTTQERVHFLEGLPPTLPAARLAALDAALALTGTANAEVAQRWYPLAIRSAYAPPRAALTAFLERVGRRKLVMPIYRALAATPEGRAEAQRIFARARAGYHPITASSVAALLAAPAAP